MKNKKKFLEEWPFDLFFLKCKNPHGGKHITYSHLKKNKTSSQRYQYK